MKKFRNRNIVITGAGSGIGRATAMAFAKEGGKLYIADIVKDRIEKVASEIRENGADATAFVLDVSDKESVEKFANEVIEKAGRVDILMNNAGVSIGSPIEKITLEEWEKLININLWGVIYGVHYFLPAMIRQGGESHIVNTASAAGLVGAPTLSAYCTTKFAVVGLSEVMNIELEKYGINTTALCPGIINTPLISETPVKQNNSDGKALKEKLVRFYEKKGASPDEVARDVLKAIRKKRPVKMSPNSHVAPLWALRRLSIRLYQSIVRRRADFLN